MYTNEKPTTAVVLLITLLACSVLCEAVAAVPQADASPAHKGKGHGKHKRDKHDPLSCSYTESCVPTVKQYDNLGAEGPGPFSEWIECFGPYVLCSVANCSIIADSGTPLVPLQAECGCLSPLRDSEDAIGKSYVTPNIIKSQSVYNATRQVCYGGEDPATGVENTCTLNSAPVCRAINSDTMYDGIWPYISTYVVYANQGAQVCTGASDGSSIIADCMTAACYKKEAWDGSPYTCYCPVYTVTPNTTYYIGYPRNEFPDGIPCQQPDGYVISGA